MRLLSLSGGSPYTRRWLRMMSIVYRIELEQEEDGRWIAEILELPGVMTYGSSPDEARAKVQALALRVVADQLEHGEAGLDPEQARSGPGFSRKAC